MRPRLLPTLVSVAAMAASVLVVAGPAHATAQPGIGTLDLATPGEVSGQVLSDTSPFVFVAVDNGFDVPTRALVALSAGSGDFELSTWGYGEGTSLAAWACPTSTYVAAGSGTDECSVELSTAFTPNDPVPGITWFTDDEIGPGDPDPSITVTDPNGGGVLVASQENTAGNNVYAETVITPGAPVSVDVINLDDGVIQLSRCAADMSRCTQFYPDQSRPLSVMQSLYLQGNMNPIDPVSSVADSSFRLQVLGPNFFDAVAGTGTLTWHLENTNAPGVQVGPEHTSVQSATDASGYLAAQPLTADGIPDGDYVVAGTLDFEHADFGLFDDVEFVTTSFSVDVHAPVLQVTPNYSTIYPNVNTKTRPGKVSWAITGTGHQEVARAEIRSSGGTLIRQASVTTGSTRSVVQFDGRQCCSSQSKAVPSGYYKLLLWDQVGNPVAKYGVVRVDARRLVTKTWRKTISAAGSVVDQYVGKCSTLRKPAARGWAYSLGYYANTKCGTQTTAASLVSTVHAVDVPHASDGYVNLKVSVYGGSATAKPGSLGVLRYLTAGGDWTTERTLPSPLGWHSGYTRTAAGMLYRNRNFAWGFYTGYGHRYDVQKFTVVVTYRTLG